MQLLIIMIGFAWSALTREAGSLLPFASSIFILILLAIFTILIFRSSDGGDL